MSNDNIDYASGDPSQPDTGPFLAKVVSHLVPSYMGVLEVEILRPVGNTQDSGQVVPVKMMSPFWGQTGVQYTSEGDNSYNGTQKSYGMWFVPPDVGTTVVVIFINGDPKRGYWIGCVPDENMNFMVPGIAATAQVVEGGGRLPVAEYNKKANPEVAEATQIKKPRHPLADALETQGLVLDDIRGITTSSARRELPSSVFGISTPGPRDKRSGAPQGKVGKSDTFIQTFISRLGGTTFVMDDGDDKFLRKTKASEGPPVYASVEQSETDGQPDIPHNELVRIRTRTGHQILLHNSEDLIYIGNARGTTWIELTSNGKIDIYAKDSISVHSEADINFTAENNINLTAKQDVNIKAGKNFNATAATDYNIKAGTDGKLTVGGTSHINAATEHRETAGTINMNGPGAASATSAIDAPRVPLQEPWAGHENLHKPEADWNKAYKPEYTTATDPFKQERPSQGNQ